MVACAVAGACSPQADEAQLLPGLLDIAVAPETRLAPDCMYWNDAEASMRRPPENAACVSVEGRLQDVTAVYDRTLRQTEWRAIDEHQNIRLYEKAVSPGCTRRLSVGTYATRPPSTEAREPESVIVFALHPGPICEAQP